MAKKTFLNRILIASLVAVGLVTTSLTAQAIQFELGASLSTVVTRVSDTKDSDSSTEAIAVIATAASFVPYVSLVGEENYFNEKTNFGWTYQIWGSSFVVDQQEVDGDFSDEFGTELSGTYLYALPQVYYRFGDRFSSKSVRNWRVTVGAGYGISYVDLGGNIRLTKSSSDTNTENIKINAAEFYYSFGIFVKAAYDKYFFSISNNLPQVRDDDNDLLFRIHNVSYTLGYQLVFDFEFSDLLD